MLLEVNVAGEGSKNGVPLAGVDAFVERASGGDKVVFGGLMTMPPFAEEPEEARPISPGCASCATGCGSSGEGRHDFEALSMGTTQDFEVAVEEGATIVRLGSVLYR